MADPGNGIELRSINDASQDDCEGFCRPRFDGVSSAILIADQYVFAYGDVQIEADDISKDKKHVVCTVSLCGSIVSFFRIPAETFDSLFGLKENFPEQYEKPVQEENDLIEEAKRNIELCKDSLCSTKQMIERLIDLTKCALIDIEDREFELGDMLSKLTQKEERREEKMEMRFAYNSDQVAMYRVKTLREFERIIRDLLERHEKPYRLFISYKCGHRVKKLSGRVFMWDETEETRNGIDVESGEQGFVKPRFDGVWAALFITDECVVAYGNAKLIAEEEIGKSGEDVLCNVYLCGRLAEQFKMRRDIFIRFFAQW